MMQEKFRVPARVLDVIELDAYGNNLLQYACDEGWVELVEELLRGEGMTSTSRTNLAGQLSRC